MKNLLLLPGLHSFSDLSLFLLRAFVGVFLIVGVWDNIQDPARMQEFVGFLRQFKFAAPELMAPLSVWAQFICGALFILGLFTRWAGLVMAFNFIVAFVMVHLADDFRAQFPALILVAVSLHFAAMGGGRLAVDRLLK